MSYNSKHVFYGAMFLIQSILWRKENCSLIIDGHARVMNYELGFPTMPFDIHFAMKTSVYSASECHISNL